MGSQQLSKDTSWRETNRALTSSFMTPLSTCPVCVPRTNTTVRGSSTSFGSLASNARFDRAFLGFLGVRSTKKRHLTVSPQLSTQHSHDPEHLLEVQIISALNTVGEFKQPVPAGRSVTPRRVQLEQRGNRQSSRTTRRRRTSARLNMKVRGHTRSPTDR